MLYQYAALSDCTRIRVHEIDHLLVTGLIQQLFRMLTDQTAGIRRLADTLLALVVVGAGTPKGHSADLLRSICKASDITFEPSRYNVPK